MTWFLVQLLKRVAAIAATLYLLWIALFDLYPNWRNNRDDPFYAAFWFDGLLSYDRIIASRRWYYEDYYSCKYGVVSLSADPAPQPPVPFQQSPSGLTEVYRWPKPAEWQTTPVKDEVAKMFDTPISDLVAHCGRAWPDGEADRLTAALDMPGSFFAVGERNTIFIYAPTVRIAALVQILAH